MTLKNLPIFVKSDSLCLLKICLFRLFLCATFFPQMGQDIEWFHESKFFFFLSLPSFIRSSVSDSLKSVYPKPVSYSEI